MKKNRILKTSLIAMIFCAFCGCANNQNVQTGKSISENSSAIKKIEKLSEKAAECVEELYIRQYKVDYSCYEELIAYLTDCLKNGFPDEVASDDFSCVFHMNNTYETLGYLKMDIDKDGIEELLLGANGEIWDGIIYDIYTMKDGQMIHVLDGWERSRYFLCKDGQTIANEWSGSAFITGYDYYKYDGSCFKRYKEEGNRPANLIETVYTSVEKNPEDMWCYSEVGYCDEYEKITEQQAFEVIKKYEYQILEYTPFIE